MIAEMPKEVAEDTETGIPRENTHRPDAPFYETPEEKAELLEALGSRDPYARINVEQEEAQNSAHREKVDELIAKAEVEERALAGTRAGLGIPHQGGQLAELKEVKKRLDEDQHHIELAAEHEHTLDSLSEFSSEEREHIAKTGRTKEGEYLHDKHGKRLHADLAKELAHMYIRNGGPHMNWGDVLKLGEVADKILHDIVSVVKGVFGGGEEKSLAE